jgi:hypothetical protein
MSMWRLLICCIALLLAGCVTAPMPGEFLPFQAAPPESRHITGAVKIYITRTNDLENSCNYRKSFAYSIPIKMLEGCAKWLVSRKECFIFVRPDADAVIIGHELRHCFEGSFH